MVAVLEVRFYRLIQPIRGINHHVLCARQFLDRVAGCVVIPVCVADQKDFDVSELEPKFLDARTDGTFSSMSLLIKM